MIYAGSGIRRLVLASGSPRRRQLLSLLGIPFVVKAVEIDESPLPGEIIFAEGDTVLTRRWTWRQANHTLTLSTSTAFELNVDGLPPVLASEVEEVCWESVALIERFCGGRTRYELLTRENPRIRITE